MIWLIVGLAVVVTVILYASLVVASDADDEAGCD